ncbi:MAG: BamA/TamA family outer membrane protein, partial [candidate division Zixibacteria bacterium]|nr:BamA/TamA family outer membrane protein [candidate division Zixibacteria bacterium]
YGWDYATDMWMRDATINGYLAPLDFLNGYNAYREGQALLKYIADKYGENKIGQLFKKGKIYLSMNKVLKNVIGIDEKKLWKEFSKEMKRRYWPEIAVRMEVEEIARKLTNSRKDGSMMNEKPVYSPDGDKIAIFTDKSDFTEIVLISADDGSTLDRLVKSSRSGGLESLHSYVSGMSFSPDGNNLVFVAKSHGKESLFFYDLIEKEISSKKRFEYYNILSPAWSPDGEKVAFSALEGNKRDIFVYYVDTDSIEQLTNDRYDDVELNWFPESDKLAFSSDRPHPRNQVNKTDQLDTNDTDPAMNGCEYGYYNVFTIDLTDRKPAPLDVGPGHNRLPVVSPDGSKIAFVSNRNGIDNIYIAYTDSEECYAVTDILTGVSYLSWSPDSDKLVFEAFYRGAFDIFVLEKLTPVGDNGVLTLTSFKRGDYNPDETGEATVVHEEPDSTAESLAALDSGMEHEYETYAVDTAITICPDDSIAAGSPQNSDDTLVTDEIPEEDSVITETGIHDGEYVFVSDKSEDPLEQYMQDIPDERNKTDSIYMPEEPDSFDSIPPPTLTGDYEIHKYKVRFTPDYIGGGFGYDTFFGLRGQTLFMFSDYLGNHQIVLATDLVNTIDQSNIQAYYFNSQNRINLGGGLFHSKNFYLDDSNFLFSDRFYGFHLYASRPFSTFSRLELGISQFFVDREYPEANDDRENRNTNVTIGDFAWVTDNIIWGITGPINGRRARLSIGGGINVFGSDGVDFYSTEFDYRRYWHYGSLYSLAFRMSGGASFGRTPKLYFVGGTSNWIGNRTLDAKVYEVENLYFSDVITPLRGVDYYGLSGNRYGLINMEFRYPMIEYFAMRFPLPLVISRVGGAIFLDIGTAWYDDKFKGGISENGASRLNDIKTGFGFGMRANLGFILLRYDLAWETDFYSVSEKPTYYFSLGADF